MEINTLVTHKHLSSLGIGIISEKLKRSVKVRFGESDFRKLKLEELKPVDVSQCKTITEHDWKSTDAIKHKYVITGNVLQRWNGIGWIAERSITHDDLMRFKIVLLGATVALENSLKNAK